MKHNSLIPSRTENYMVTVIAKLSRFLKKNTVKELLPSSSACIIALLQACTPST